MASEIRVNKINSRTGVGTITLSPTGVDFTGIATAATLRATTGIVTSLTAGSLTSLGAVSGTTGTFSGAVSGTTGTFSGAVSGTTGTFSSTTTVEGALTLVDTIVHSGDDNTKIRFPAADTVTVETAGSERLRIASNGSVGFNTTLTSAPLTVNIAGDYKTSTQNVADEGLIFQSFTTASTGDVYPGISWSGQPTALGRARAAVTAIATNDNAGSDLVFLTRNQADGTELDVTDDEKLRINSSGNIGIGTASPNYLTTIAAGSGNAKLNLKRLNDASNGNAFGSLFYTNSAGNDVASVRAHRESAADNAYLAFGTRNTGGSISERLRITSTGIKRVQNGNLNIYSTYIDFSGDVSTPTTAAAIFRPADNTLAFSTGNNERLRILSGGGITFNGDTATANALDDYEEGDWTPAMNSGGWTSFTVNTAKYVKIGGQVFVQCYVSALQGSGTGNVLKLQGLPFNPIANGYTVGSVDMGEGSVKGTYCRTESDTNQISFLYPSENNSSARVTLKGNQIGDAYIILGLTYFTSS